MLRSALRIAREGLFPETSPAVLEEQRRTLLLRARALCGVALLVYPFTILTYAAAFFPDQLGEGLAIAAIADLSAAFLLLGLVRGLFDRRPSLAMFLLLGVISNVAELATLTITGGPTTSSFFFPYYLIFFGIATFFPGRLPAVLTTCLALPLGYVALGASRQADGVAFWSNVILLVDYAAITTIANRLVTTVFIREATIRLELQSANERLLELDRMKNEFFANISHELRTPLTLMLAPASTLLERSPGPLTTEQERLVVGMKRNASRLLGLINDLLLLAKLEAKREMVTRSRVRIGKAVLRTVEAMQPYADSLKVSLTVEVSDEADDWVGDADHLDRIVMNLVSNACKFSNRGGEVRVTLDRGDGRYVLAVEDEGVGVAEADLERLFDRFVQVDAGSNRQFEGTGIGLALVRELVELHDGHVEVDSTLGEGSTFRVVLPIVETDDAIAEVDRSDDALDIAPVIGEPITTYPKPASSEAPRVMVVEDNDDLLTLLRQELSRRYEVIPVAESEDALAEAKRSEPDLILSDVMMPVVDGIELARILRADPKTKDTPILLMSALEELDTKLAGFEAGVDDYVSKPFQMPELVARIDTHLRLRSQAAALSRALEDLKRSEASLLHNERMALLGTVVAGVAHEINNPVHFLQGNLKLLTKAIEKREQEGQSARIDDMVGDMLTSVQRLTSMTGELLRFGRKDTAPNEDVKLKEAVDLAIRIVQGKTEGVRFESKLAGDEVAYTNPQSLFQVVLNLLQNASQAEAERVEVRSRSVDGMIELSFRDDGCGIDEDVLDHVKEPFYTTKAPGLGTGLGLSIVQKLVTAQGGEVLIDSAKGRGTTVSVRLPAARGAV